MSWETDSQNENNQKKDIDQKQQSQSSSRVLKKKNKNKSNDDDDAIEDQEPKRQSSPASIKTTISENISHDNVNSNIKIRVNVKVKKFQIRPYTPIVRSSIYKFLEQHRMRIQRPSSADSFDNSKNQERIDSKLTSLKSSLGEEDSYREPERITSIGLLVWSHRFTDLSGLKMVDNYLCPFEPEPQSELKLDGQRLESTDFCDFIFPILIGLPDHRPLNQNWIKKINQLMKPGCYLVCARPRNPHHWSSVDFRVNVEIWRTGIRTSLPRLDADLLFIMHSACKNDHNLNVTEFVNFIDDLDSVKGHFFPHRISQNMYTVLTPRRFVRRGNYEPPRPKTHLQKLVHEMIRQPSEESLSEESYDAKDQIKRELKRHNDLVRLYQENLRNDVHRVRETFVTDRPKDERHFYSERFNFFLSQDSFAIILDQNSAFDRMQWKIVRDLDDKKHHPFVRLIRSGASVAIEGAPRYANLRDGSQTFHQRSIFKCRLTQFPMLILQEGVKAFDAYYNNDGLDFTYFDSTAFTDLIIIDWYQIQIDLKMDQKQRSFKGHLMGWDDLTDILPTMPRSLMQPSSQSDLQSPRSASNNTQESIGNPEEPALNYVSRPLVIFTLQQVLFTYFNPLKSRLEIVWNCFMRVEENHIHPTKFVTNCMNPAYIYIKSYNLIYLWTQKDRESPLQEEKSSENILSNLLVSNLDLAKVGWSHRQYEEYSKEYHARIAERQEAIKNWLTEETRKVKRQLMVRPTTLTDKLMYRNGFYLMKLEQLQKEKALKPRKSFLVMKDLSPKSHPIKSVFKKRSKSIKQPGLYHSKSPRKTSLKSSSAKKRTTKSSSVKSTRKSRSKSLPPKSSSNGKKRFSKSIDKKT